MARRITWNETTFDADVLHLAMLDRIDLLTRQRDNARRDNDRWRAAIRTALVALEVDLGPIEAEGDPRRALRRALEETE